MYIDGQWINAKNNATFPVFNPANGENIGDVPDGDREDAAGAIDAAQRAFEKWSTLTAYKRSGYLYEAYRIISFLKPFELSRPDLLLAPAWIQMLEHPWPWPVVD